jgi:hypothetical protein
MDAADVVTLVYGEQRLGEPSAVVARRHAPGSGWTRARTLARDGYPVGLEVDHGGNVLVVFSVGSRRVASVYRPAGGAWRRARRLTPPGTRVDGFDLAMNDAGNALLAWVRGNGDVEALRKDAGRPWSQPTLAAPSGGAAAFVTASIDEGSNALVAWGLFEIGAASQAPGEEWSASATVPGARNAVVEVLDSTTGYDGGFVVLTKKEELALRARDVVPTIG